MIIRKLIRKLLFLANKKENSFYKFYSALIYKLLQEKWANLFSTIVSEAKTIHVLESMDPRRNFSKLV